MNALNAEISAFNNCADGANNVNVELSAFTLDNFLGFQIFQNSHVNECECTNICIHNLPHICECRNTYIHNRPHICECRNICITKYPYSAHICECRNICIPKYSDLPHICECGNICIHKYVAECEWHSHMWQNLNADILAFSRKHL